MTLQDNQIVGVEPIIAKICEDALLSHRKVPSHITAQPSLNNTILVMTQGSCYFEGAVDQENQMAFVEFFLIGMNETGFFIVNQIFSMHGF
ncbi:hypothetical protein TRFO_03469 [Tritrichomonas foetus]|uniref:Nuclear transport factor 2 domain-containing protein n=1 Tax=Tritrichomonas foetus TaxID=1144522 RepID=A0A1J4KP29_9EUKA|nr:hypothetical protein TRFO_03469 [Tritrichomonas foetus]|eukprot:OHT13049.1 hypothetical protein TRFO_03469 [Tritrichomonas foetus]